MIVDFTNPYEEVRSADEWASSFLTWTAGGRMRFAQVHGQPFPFRSSEGRVALVIDVKKVCLTKLPFEHSPPAK